MKTHLESTIELALQTLQERNYDKAEPLFREALQNAKQSANDIFAATCLDSLGEISFQQGWFEQAEPYYQQALEIRRKLLPPAHEEIVSSLNNLSAAYFFQGKYRQAKPLCEQLLATYEVVLGKDHPEVATCLINLGLIAMAEGKIGNAEKRFAEAHAIRSNTYEPMDVLVGNSLGHLGNAYFEQERYDLAAEKLHQALAILEKHLSPDDPDLERIVSKLIIALERIARHSELEELYPRLVNLTEIKLGPAHPEVAKYLEKLANLYLKQKKYDDAARVFQRVLSMKKRALGEVHPEVAQQLTNLASIREASGHPAQAETLLMQALSMFETYKRKDHTVQQPVFVKYIEAIKNLAAFYVRDKRYAKAERQWQLVMQFVEPQASVYPQLLLEAYQQLSECFLQQNKLDEAKALLEKALRLLEDSGKNSFAQLIAAECTLMRATTVTKLGNILKIQGKYTEAEIHYKNALDILMKALGTNHPDLAPTLEAYADLLTKTYREAEAEHMLACAKNLTKKT